MPLHQHATEFAQRNLLLQLCLGLQSHGLTLQSLLARYAPSDGPRGVSAPGDDALIAATLGLAAFFARVDEHLKRAASSAPPPPAPAARVVPPRGLLR